MKKLAIAALALVLFAGCKKSSSDQCQCYYLDNYIRYAGQGDSLFTLSSPPNKTSFSDRCANGQSYTTGSYLGTTINGLNYNEFGGDTGFGNHQNIPIYCH